MNFYTNIFGYRISIWHFLIVCLLLILIYGYIVRRYLKTDMLQGSFASCSGCDFWAISHIIFYALLGYFFPGYTNMIVFTYFGIVWEVIEESTGSPEFRRAYLGSFKGDKWWYGRVTDIAFNSIGLIIGNYIASILKPCETCPHKCQSFKCQYNSCCCS